jgi:hypothetical protein
VFCQLAERSHHQREKTFLFPLVIVRHESLQKICHGNAGMIDRLRVAELDRVSPRSRFSLPPSAHPAGKKVPSFHGTLSTAPVAIAIGEGKTRVP